MRYLYLDISTAPIEGAVDYLESADAPANYKDPQKIADYIKDANQKALDRAALDMDLCRITGAGLAENNERPCFWTCKTEDDERIVLQTVANMLRQQIDAPPAQLVGYNSMRFDWPVLMRRARYLGVKLTINLDRYKSSHIDVSEAISNRGSLPIKSLGFYVKRLGWTDLVKPLDGAEEAQVFVNGKWAELEQSLAHDVEAVRRLHQWWEQR
jgi:hypothetical protein